MWYIDFHAVINKMINSKNRRPTILKSVKILHWGGLLDADEKKSL